MDARRRCGLLSAALLLGCSATPNPTSNAPPSDAGPTSPCDLGAKVTYQGGPLLTSVQVTTFFWGKAVSDLRSRINQFFADITGGSFVAWLAEYDTPTQTIGPGAFVGTRALANAPAATPQGSAQVISDDTIRGELQQLVDEGAVVPSPSSVYFFYMPPGVVITDPNNRVSAGHFDGYHGSFLYKGNELYYAVIPDPAASASQHGMSPYDLLTVVSSHELAEAITDPSTANGAWFDPALGEIGDICAWQFSTSRALGYTVQREWSNTQAGCVYGPGSLDLTVCGQACVDVTIDVKNCGGCGGACNLREICVAGSCHATTTVDAGAPPRCDTAKLSADPFNCGACGNECNAVSICAGGVCQPCSAGQVACHDSCVDTTNDSSNCGSCGFGCDGQACIDGACQLCQGSLCSTGCTDSSSDPYNCGSCGTVCPSGLCSQGLCQDCPGTETACGDSCTDTSSDPLNCSACGKACALGQDCTAGSCQACPAAETFCGGGCTDTSSDPANCGSCGNYCDAASSCTNGACQPCAPGLSACDNSCTNTDADPNNCGGCNAPCAAGAACVNGFCQSCSVECDGVCTDTGADPANCGSCGNDCGTAATCNAGACQPCPSGQTACSNVCTDTTADPANCGNCNLVCSIQDACMSGSCQSPCPGTETVCGSACSDTTSDPNNCGACGNPCPAGQGCSQGVCQ